MAVSSAPANAAVISNDDNASNYRTAFIVITSLFFMWGFITCLNDILIPFLKKIFELDRFQSMFVQFTFFGAYFIGSVIYFIISVIWGDPMSKMGYKNGLLLGLVISALACAGFYPAAAIKEYGLFLAMLFFLGIGFTLLQIAANPYVALLGKRETASSRLNFSQAFNSFGTTIAPVIGGFLVFHFFAKIGTPLLNKAGQQILTDTGLPMTALGVQLPYLVFAVVFLLLAVLIKFTHLPQFISHESIEKGMGALRYPHLVLGGVSIFVYVGAEVSIGSLFINYAFESVKTGNPFAFSNVTPFLFFLALQYFGFIIGKSKAGRTLLVFSLIVIGLLLCTMGTSGMTALWMVIGIGLFNSIMWSNIFTLAIEDLGQHTSQGSSLLVMMILGGALVPLFQGKVADMMHGYHLSFFIPIVCYGYLAFYGWKGHRHGKRVA